MQKNQTEVSTQKNQLTVKHMALFIVAILWVGSTARPYVRRYLDNREVASRPITGRPTGGGGGGAALVSIRKERRSAWSGWRSNSS